MPVPLLAAAIFAAGSGQAFAAPRHSYIIPDQRSTVQGWRVTNLAEDDGGRLVRMTRRVGPHVMVYEISFWHANNGPYARASVDLPNGNACAEDHWQRDPDSRNVWAPETDLPARARAVRALFTSGLANCRVAAGGITAALRGFDGAFALMARWAELSRRSTIAESLWISRH